MRKKKRERREKRLEGGYGMRKKGKSLKSGWKKWKQKGEI